MTRWFFKLGRRRAAITCGLLLLALLIPFSYIIRTRSAGSTAANGDAAATDTSVVKVRRGDIRKTLLLDGELRAVSSRTIFSSTSEEVKITYLPPEGSLVKAGDRVLELDSGTILGKIKDIEEKIIASENDIVKTRAQHEAALRDMEVQLSVLWQGFEKAKVDARVPAGVLPRRKHQESQLAYEKTKAEYENQLTKIEQKKKEQAAELQVKVIEKEKLGVQLNQVKSNLDGMNLKAPADGMVIYSDHWYERRKIQVGDVVWGGFPLVRLPDLKEMEVMAQVNEVDGPRLSIGQKATVHLDSYPDTEITGSVKSIAQTAIKASWMAKAKVFRAVISLDRTAQEIMKPGMSAQIAISIAEQPNQLLVPRSAVEFSGDSTTVMRIEGEDQVRPIAVTILSADASHYAIAEGGALKEGDRIRSRFNSVNSQ
jgi:HlyD family secretion protein